MSTELPKRQSRTVQQIRIKVVCATYNEKFTSPLLQNCIDEIKEIAPYAHVEVQRVPGAFEVPVVVKQSIVRAPVKPDVVIALGVILRGSTAHADLIGSSITTQLMSIACDTLVPVIHEVLLLDDEKQAFARCIASTLNRGREAGRAAIAMADLDDSEVVSSSSQYVNEGNRVIPTL